MRQGLSDIKGDHSNHSSISFGRTFVTRLNNNNNLNRRSEQYLDKKRKTFSVSSKVTVLNKRRYEMCWNLKTMSASVYW